MKTIIDIVCEYFNLTPNAIFNHARKEEIRRPRQILFYLLREHTFYSLKEIGQEALNHDIDKPFTHATVLHSFKVIKEEMELYSKIKKTIDEITVLIDMSSPNFNLLEIAKQNTYELSA